LLPENSDFKPLFDKKTITKQNNFHRIYEQNCPISMENCLSFIKDNIQDQAFKTWFEPIKSVELTDNALYIQVPSKFFYEWLEEHYVKLLK
jgi:chromosomal replication initiator protein